MDDKEKFYLYLGRRMLWITLLVSFAPLFALGITMYYQFDKTTRQNTKTQSVFMAQSQAEAVDLFLKERTTILNVMADTHTFQEISNETYLYKVFNIMNSRAGDFVDLGVIDHQGRHCAYVGPYDLKDKNYFHQPWFDEVISRGIYKSDVFMGFRQLPHFIIAVRRYENQKPWILRATIDPGVVESIVRRAQVGKKGDAFLINKSNTYQTQPRFEGPILSAAYPGTSLFGGRVAVMELKDSHGKKYLYAGTWLDEISWLLIVKQDPLEPMSGLFEVQFFSIFIISFGVIAIIMASVFTTRMFIAQLKKADQEMSELNAQLVQADKLAALGKLAAGVAHEINNPLAVILQQVGWMSDLLEEEAIQNSPSVKEYRNVIQKIEHHVDRAQKVVHNMLGYARKMEPRLEDVDINMTINQTITFLENYSRINNIDIQTNLSEDLPIIAGNQSELQQVFLNLLTNAIDAIGNEGVIEVKTWCDPSKIYVSIKDNGPGLSEEMQKKIFDPFYTTKELGRGTGLGLWVTYNIIMKTGGAVNVKSVEGAGATFTVELPIVTPEKK